MRKLALTALVAAFAGTAAAAGTTVIDFNDFTAPGFSGQFAVLAGSIPNVAAAPNATPFLVVPSESVSNGVATYSSANAITSLSFDWGTPDDYNTLTFYNGATVVGSPISGGGKSAGVFTYTFAASDHVTSVSFGSTNRAFEIDNLSVTAVPEPATWGLMLVGFGLVGFASRRRTTTVTA